jgi:prolyl-tRNA synthetase
MNGDTLAESIGLILHDMQKDLFVKTKNMRESNTVTVETYDEFKKALDDGKFVLAHWD